MTDGEKMIWSAVFGHTYAVHQVLFRTDPRGKNHDIQRDEHATQSATLAAEAATRAVEAARRIQSCDIDHETAVMVAAVFECDGPDDE